MKLGLQFLAQLSELDVDWLLAVGVPQEFPAGAVLIDKGQADCDLILLLEGAARVFDAESGREFARIEQGELLGEISFIDKKGATASVATTEASRVFSLPKERLEEKLARDPVFAGRFYRMIAGFLSGRLRGLVAPEADAGSETGRAGGMEVVARARLDRLLSRILQRRDVVLNGQDLTLEQVVEVSLAQRQVTISVAAQARLRAAREVVEEVACTDRAVYGLNTGLGALRTFRVEAEDAASFQRKILVSHAVGIPPEYPPHIARAIMLARLNGMARGGAGISPAVFNRLLLLLNRDIVPIIPRRGSVGMADLAPLAHMSLPLVGEGEVWFAGERMPAGDALARAGLAPIELAAKDGVSLVSANSAATGHGALVLARLMKLLSHADLAAALSIDAFLANPSPLDERLITVRPHQGQVMTTMRLRALLDGSSCHDPSFRRSLQDPISFRCIPHVHGPCQETLAVARRVVEMELNSTTDNPVVLPEARDIVSNGNFHPAGLAIAFETLSLSIAHLASIAASRTLRLNDPAMTGLPAQLVARPGLNSGLGVLQKTVTMLNAHVRYLAAPASLDFMPVAGSIEDHSTMATAVVGKLEEQIEACEHILAIEMLTAAQAIDMRKGTALGRGTGAAYRRLREEVGFMLEDRNISLDVAAVCRLVRDGSLLIAVTKETGLLLSDDRLVMAM
ncbi:MAG: aromatic amino acid lyase [Hyphomicrobiaceae bacterium]|nr:aromatic amino acid lyase [Hyphomicrobiaceae bacterium]